MPTYFGRLNLTSKQQSTLNMKFYPVRNNVDISMTAFWVPLQSKQSSVNVAVGIDLGPGDKAGYDTIQYPSSREQYTSLPNVGPSVGPLDPLVHRSFFTFLAFSLNRATTVFQPLSSINLPVSTKIFISISSSKLLWAKAMIPSKMITLAP